MEIEYSPGEQKLIRHFGFGYLLERENGTPVYPAMLYQIMASKAFMINETGVYADALRKCMLHLEAGKYRLTDEFEEIFNSLEGEYDDRETERSTD